VTWQAFANEPVYFGRREAVPVHWRSFGKRGSSRTGTPRRAITPANAILNLLLGGLVTEITIALYAVGLDPFLGVGLHEDKPDRALLAYDLAEPARWIVERWFFSLLQTTTFSKRDFFRGFGGSDQHNNLPVGALSDVERSIALACGGAGAMDLCATVGRTSPVATAAN